MAIAERIGTAKDRRDVQITVSIDEANFLKTLVGSIGKPNIYINNLYDALTRAGVEGLYIGLYKSLFSVSVDLSEDAPR